MPHHIHPSPAKGHAFRLKAKALLQSSFTGQFDHSSCAEHTMPGEPYGTAQHSHYLPGSAGISSRASDCAIGGNFACGNFADGGGNAR